MARLLSISIYVLSLLLAFNAAYSQTCTITGTSPLNWVNPGPNCVEGGTASGKSVLTIPAGFTVVFDSNGDTWTGTRIDVYGTLVVNFDVIIRSSITVYNGGLLTLGSKLSMGTASGCGYGLSIKPGGTVNVGDTGSDRLSICGTELMKGAAGGSCNDCGGTYSGKCAVTNKPYCEPTGGFQGPLGYDEDGYDVVLPIKLASLEAFQADTEVLLTWSTATEENFDRFIIEHSTDGKHFDSIGSVKGAGNSKLRLNYSFTDTAPIIGKNYYRLKSVDYDLSAEYSPLVVANFKNEKNVIVYPNPAAGNVINVRTNFAPQEDDRIEIYDNLGLKLMEFRVAEHESILRFKSLIKTGMYLLRYVSKTHTQTIRFDNR